MLNYIFDMRDGFNRIKIRNEMILFNINQKQRKRQSC